MKSVFIILCDYKISNEGYDTVDKAIDFIESRSYNPIQNKDRGWLWTDSKGEEYRIKEITIR